MTALSELVTIEGVAIALYESDCRAQAGDMARRTTLSRIRAHYSFPSWANLTDRQRASWRAKAMEMATEAGEQLAEQEAWDGHEKRIDQLLEWGETVAKYYGRNPG